MSKKNALGEINLDFEESINTINGIPITPTKAQNEAQKEEVIEEKQESINEEDINIEDILNTEKNKSIFNEEEEKSIFEDRKKLYDKQPKEEVMNKLEEERKKQLEKVEKKKDDKPSTKKHLKEGYTRHTFAIKDEQLELIRAIAEYKGIEQKKLLESLLNKAFENIDEKTKKKALNYLHNKTDDTDLDIFN